VSPTPHRVRVSWSEIIKKSQRWWEGRYTCENSSAIDLLLGVDDVQESILGVSVLLVDGLQVDMILHQVLPLGQQDHALVLVPVELELLPDNGENFAHLKGVGHQKPIKRLAGREGLLGVAHVIQGGGLTLFLGLLSPLNNQGELIRVLSKRLIRPLLSLLYISMSFNIFLPREYLALKLRGPSFRSSHMLTLLLSLIVC